MRVLDELQGCIRRVYDLECQPQVSDFLVTCPEIARSLGLIPGARRIEVVLEIRTPQGPMVLASTTLKGKIEFSESYREKVRDRIRYILPAEM